MFASYVPPNAFSAWNDPSYDVIGQMLGGSDSWNFQGGRKKDGRKAIEKNGDNRTVNKKDIPEKPQGGCINPPVPARVKPITGGGGWIAPPPASFFCSLQKTA